MDYQLQVITLSVSDVDKAMAFYTQQAGFGRQYLGHPGDRPSPDRRRVIEADVALPQTVRVW